MITPELLRSLPLFSALDEPTLQTVARRAADIHLVAGEWLVQEGEPAAFWVLISGDIDVTKQVGGVEQVINHYRVGDFFGEVPLLLGSAAVANLRAATDIRVMRLSDTDFHDLMARSEKIAATIMQTMTRRVTLLQQVAVEHHVETVLLVGSRSDLQCYDLREFFSGNHLDFRWLDPEDPSDASQIPAEAARNSCPAVVFPDGTVLSKPSRIELANRLGLQTAPTRTEYDVTVIGAGPAGLAASVYGASEGLQMLMVERSAPGGQAGTSSRIENYLGFPTGLSGEELAVRALQQAKRFGTEITVARTATELYTSDKFHEVVLDGGEAIKARTIILATGVSWRTLSIPRAKELIGRGIYYGAARTEALTVQGKDVYLIGGGNSAGQAAMFFSGYARQVTLLIRADSIQKGMSHYLIGQIAAKPNIAVRLCAEVIAVQGEAHLESITVQNNQTQATEVLATDSLFVLIGADAETSWLPDNIARDERGYVLTGLEAQGSGKWPLKRDPYLLETSVPGVFAAGDVRHGSIKRVASGVGEGSMAIAFIHQFLALSAVPA